MKLTKSIETTIFVKVLRLIHTILINKIDILLKFAFLFCKVNLYKNLKNKFIVHLCNKNN